MTARASRTARPRKPMTASRLPNARAQEADKKARSQAEVLEMIGTCPTRTSDAARKETRRRRRRDPRESLRSFATASFRAGRGAQK